MRSRRVVMCALVWLQLAGLCHAWSRPGHELVAHLAWNRLDEETRSRLFIILRAHPSFPVWEKEAVAAAVADWRAYVVGRAAVWPDDIKRRSSDNPFRVEPDQVHSDWHYIDQRISFDGTRVTEPPTPNAVTALARCEATLRRPGATRRERAEAICWILHLVGDLHQPLHCVERVSRALPGGDQGGNLWAVCRPEGRVINLHALWDGLVVHASTDVPARARALEGGGRPKFCGGDSTVWITEGKKLAVTQVYCEGAVPGAVITDPKHLPREVEPLSAHYVAQAESVAMRRMLVGGVRLAVMLDRLLRPLPAH